MQARRETTPPKDDNDDDDVRSLQSNQDRKRAVIRRLAVQRLSRSQAGDNGTEYHATSVLMNTPVFHTTTTTTSAGVMDDDVSSLGGVEDQTTAVQRITLALKHGSARPSGLTREERALWNTIQGAVKHAKEEMPEASKQQDWKVKHEEASNRLQLQDNEHQAALRAIQRVLADVTAERDRAIAELRDWRDQEANRRGGEAELQTLHVKLAGKENSIRRLEEELKDAQSGSPGRMASNEHLHQRLEEVEAERDAARHQIDDLSCKSRASEAGSDLEMERLRRELSGKIAGLENAKKIIASLESASGSLASDMRSKLKGKDETITLLKAELSDRQRTAENLATQLRDLRRDHVVKRHSQRMDEERARRLGLSSRLEKNMDDLRAAAVIIESTNDPSALDQVANLLGDSILALKDGMELVEEMEDSSVEVESGASTGDNSTSASSRASIPTDPRRIRKELEAKSRTLVKVQDALRREREENSHLRIEREHRGRAQDEANESLLREIQSLREQCRTNMEVLAKKERELAVLRDSLKVDDGVGYISDDGTDASDECDHDSPVSSSVANLKVSNYGPSHAEALATLLLHGGGNTGDGKKSYRTEEFEALKVQVAQAHAESERTRKQLKTEKESLANAKMIISSLEKANKSMMEDLRSRLQDSNTAIASLLEKSMESDKTTAKLRAELDALRHEKAQECDKLENEIQMLRDDTSYRPRDGSVDEKKEEPSFAELID